LEPRFQAEAPVVSETVAVTETTAPVETSNEVPEFDPSKMRHGRRSMVKKAPAFEDESPAESTNS